MPQTSPPAAGIRAQITQVPLYLHWPTLEFFSMPPGRGDWSVRPRPRAKVKVPAQSPTFEPHRMPWIPFDLHIAQPS